MGLTQLELSKSLMRVSITVNMRCSNVLIRLLMLSISRSKNVRCTLKRALGDDYKIPLCHI